jgi:putative PIN family toxin of toxin-antitoxin system
VRVVLDAGVLIAASIAPRGVCGQLLDASRQEKIQIIISPQLLAELELVLGREKFRRWLTEPEARHAAGAIARLGELHQDPPPRPGLTPDPKDDYLITLARSAAVDYLISGDQHLTGLHDPLPPVLTPRQLLDQLKDP